MRIKIEKLAEHTKKRLEDVYKKELEKEEGSEYEESEDSLGISVLWFIAGALLTIADILEVIFDLIAAATAGVLFILPYITLIFEIPGVLIFSYLIWYYVRKNVIGRVEGAIYIIIVFYELIVTFVPVVQISDILPLKTVDRLFAGWRISRLRKVKKRIKKSSAKKHLEEQE